MKTFKLISIAIAFILVIGVAVYITAKVKDRQYQEVTLAQHKRFIIDKNTRILEAENQKALNDSLLGHIDRLNVQLAEKHNEENYQPVNITIDEPTPDVNTYIDFVPDYIPEMDTFFEDDTRVAITHYKYSDSLNKYSTTLKIKYDYKHTNFEITPQDVSFVPQKAFRYNLNILATSDKQLGAFLSYRIWRVHLGSGMLIDKQFHGVAIIGVGFNF